MAEVIATIWVCTNCLLVHANGERGEIHAESYESYFEKDLCDCGACEPLCLVDDSKLAIGTENHSDGCEGDGECDCGERGFCTTSCEGCGSTLHGERYSMVVFDS